MNSRRPPLRPIRRPGPSRDVAALWAALLHSQPPRRRKFDSTKGRA